MESIWIWKMWKFPTNTPNKLNKLNIHCISSHISVGNGHVFSIIITHNIVYREFRCVSINIKLIRFSFDTRVWIYLVRLLLLPSFEFRGQCSCSVNLRMNNKIVVHKCSCKIHISAISIQFKKKHHQVIPNLTTITSNSTNFMPYTLYKFQS